MEYQKIPHDKNKSIKLKLYDIEAVQWLYYVEKWNIAQISDRFNVSQSCIDYHLMTDEQKKERNRKCNEANARRKVYDQAYKKHCLKIAAEWAKTAKSEREDFKEWRNKKSHEQRDMDNYMEWEQRYKEEHVEEISERMKIYNSRPEIKERQRKKNREKWNMIKNDPILHKQELEKNNIWRHSPKGIESTMKYQKSERRAELNRILYEKMKNDPIRYTALKEAQRIYRQNNLDKIRVRERLQFLSLKNDPIRYERKKELDRINGKIRYQKRKLNSSKP